MFSYRVLTVTAVAAPGNSLAEHEPMAAAVRAEGDPCCIAATCLDLGETCAATSCLDLRGDSCVPPSCPGNSNASQCDPDSGGQCPPDSGGPCPSDSGGGGCELGPTCGLAESICPSDSVCGADTTCENTIPIEVTPQERARDTGAPTLSALREQLALALAIVG